MSAKPVLAIFDFCDTIFDGQSVSYFLNFLESKLLIYKKIYLKIIKKIGRVSSYDSKIYKERLMQPLCGMRESAMNEYSAEFYNKVIVKRLHKIVMDKLLFHKQEGHIVAVVSGGFDAYLKYFAKDYGVNYLLCTKLEFINGTFTSKILGNECLGNEKVRLLRDTLNLDNYDLLNSYCYSDARSDLPLFSLVGNKIVVKNTQNIDWIDEDFKILEVDKKYV